MNQSGFIAPKYPTERERECVHCPAGLQFLCTEFFFLSLFFFLRLKRLELSPEETPYISFRANHASLQDAILNYGQVDGTGLPLLMAFDDPGNPSPSLPRCVEDYEDVDHHVFHKPLKEMKMGQIPTSCVSTS